MVEMKYTPPKGGKHSTSSRSGGESGTEKIKGIFSTQSVVKVGTGTKIGRAHV